MTNSVHCSLCLSIHYKVLYDLRAATKPMGLPGMIVRCRECGFCFKILTGSVRAADVYQEEWATDKPTERYMLSEPTRVFFRQVLDGLSIKRGRLLDIGTGLGTLVEEAQKVGYDAQGVDLCRPLVDKALKRGLNVRCMSAEDLDSAEPFDVITMMDIIEHVPEPLKLLATARRILKPGGELVVYTPNHRGAVVLLAKLLHSIGIRFAIHEIFAGNHLVFFDNRTLSATLNRAGFTLRELRLFPYDPSRPGQPVSPLSLAAITAVERLGKPFHRMFRMMAYGHSQPL
jgi:2-polyprenyl-3-methyl-5-hydroxy-6-metoxy-1,4-benzoquinol methylase